MKNIYFIIFLLSGLNTYSQNTNNSEVTREDDFDEGYVSATQKVYQIDREIEMARKKIEPIKRNHANNTEDIKKYIAHNLKVRGQWESSGIDVKCREINALRSKFSYAPEPRPCNTAKKRIQNINERIKKATTKLEELDKGKNNLEKFETAKSLIDSELNKLEQENKELTNLLKTKRNKKQKSLADYLGIDADNIEELPEDNTYKIEYKLENGIYKQGVINSQDEVLIPFRKWIIKEYAQGIALVEEHYDNYECSIPSEFSKSKVGFYEGYAYKVGYVNSSGDYIDGYEIETNDKRIKNTSNTLYLQALRQNETREQKQRRERKKELREKRREKAIQKCRNDIKKWRLNIESRN